MADNPIEGNSGLPVQYSYQQPLTGDDIVREITDLRSQVEASAHTNQVLRQAQIEFNKEQENLRRIINVIETLARESRVALENQL
jgi:hypothetical protein